MKVSKTVYLAGKMRNVKDMNYPEFYQRASDLREIGYDVINPADNFDGRQDLPIEVYLKECFKQVPTADAIALIPGWESSVGAVAELYVAQLCGLEVLSAVTLQPIKARVQPYLMDSPKKENVSKSSLKPNKDESILQEADRLVNGDRQASYGRPLDDFKKTAKIAFTATLPSSKVQSKKLPSLRIL